MTAFGLHAGFRGSQHSTRFRRSQNATADVREWVWFGSSELAIGNDALVGMVLGSCGFREDSRPFRSSWTPPSTTNTHEVANATRFPSALSTLQQLTRKSLPR